MMAKGNITKKTAPIIKWVSETLWINYRNLPASTSNRRPSNIPTEKLELNKEIDSSAKVASLQTPICLQLETQSREVRAKYPLHDRHSK